MSFDLDTLRATIAAHGRVARVVVAACDGSVPREVGAAMLVWQGGASGTIGGGALEHEAMQAARVLLAAPAARLVRQPLGPALGQCCGGAVTLLTEVFDTTTLAQMTPEAGMFVRRIEGSEVMPLALRRKLVAARSEGRAIAPVLCQGWMIEPLEHPARTLWIYGAGHVGRAIVAVLAPSPDFRITWIDTAADRFPDVVPEGVEPLIAANPAETVKYAPEDAEHLILTYSHALDLELCHRLLSHGFARTGLIGSRTKWARFRKRLTELGHDATSIARITCPIGDPALGKYPQAIAVGVAAALLGQRQAAQHLNRAEGD